MNDFDYLRGFIDNKPQAAAEQTKGAAEDFLSKPVEGSPVHVSPGKAEPEKTEHVIEDKSVGTHAKESLLPKVRKVADTRERATKILGAAVPDLSEVPVPSGGIGLLVFISLLVVFAITPVNGKSGATRLSLLWGTMLGNYSIKGNSVTSSSSNSSVPSSSFGGGSSNYLNSVIQGSAT